MSMLNTQATNWQIDYGQNKAGAIYGNAIQNLGGMTGNLIMEYAQKQKEKELKDAKEQEAIKYLTAKGGMSEEEAKGVVKGVGVDNFMKMQQIDIDRKQMEQRGKIMEQEVAVVKAKTAAALAKTQALERDNAIFRHVMTGGSAPGTPPPMLARNGTPQADMGAQGTMRRMAQLGATQDSTLAAGKAVSDIMPKPLDQVRKLDLGGGKSINALGNQLIYDKEEKPDPMPKGEEVDIPMPDGTTIKAIHVGNGKYIDKRTRMEVYVRPDFMEGNIPVINPALTAKQQSGEPAEPFSYVIRKKK